MHGDTALRKTHGFLSILSYHELFSSFFIMSPLLRLPAELLLRIIYHISAIHDKVQLLQTCRHLNHLLSTNVGCWDQLDLSLYSEITNSTLLLFLKNTNIYLYNGMSGSSGNSEMNRVSQLDLSGCWCLSQDMVVALSKSFPCLETLCLNGYRISEDEVRQRKKNDVGFEQRRAHVYQVRPAHDLSSMAMDLSKKSLHRLNIPYILLSAILLQVPHITSLSIQYQDLSPTMATPYFSEFANIRYLDISSCTISQSSLQSMLRKIGRGLKSLKMLNIDLNNMTWMCLSQYGKNIKILHVSCNEPFYLTCVRHTVSHLKHLSDFRLTRIRCGTIDLVIEKLDPIILRRLDLSPKMNIYPKATAPQQTQQKLKSRKHPPQTNKTLSMSNYATTEHDLSISVLSLQQIVQCQGLVELRLCYPTLLPSWCHRILKSLPHLEIFELRLKKQANEADFLCGIDRLTRLKQLYLYSVYITEDTIQALNTSNCRLNLRHITMTQGGEHIEKLKNQQLIMHGCQLLESFHLGLPSGQQSFIKKDGSWNVI